MDSVGEDRGSQESVAEIDTLVLPAAPAMVRRANALLLAGSAVFLVAAMVLAGFGWAAYSTGSDARGGATTYLRERDRLKRRQVSADAERAAMIAAAHQLTTSFTVLLTTIHAAITADNHVVDVANSAVGLANGGNTPAAVQTFKTEVDPAVSDVVQRTSALHAALSDSQNTTKLLQETVGG